MKSTPNVLPATTYVTIMETHKLANSICGYYEYREKRYKQTLNTAVV